MRALSTKTELFDPYRAGYALGENLAALAPEVVFLYSSIHYATPELLEGLYDGLGSDKAIIIGNTGGGIYETTGFAAQGAAALGLNSDGQVRWKLLCIEHADRNLSDKLEHALATLPSDGEQPCLAYLAIDFQINAQELEQFMQKNIPYPVIGGMGNDDVLMRSCCIYVNRRVVESTLAVLLAYGQMRFSIAVGNTLQGIGHNGHVDAVDGQQVCRIDGMTASHFIERETGRPMLHTDISVVLLEVSGPEIPPVKRLRSIIPDENKSSQNLFLICGIPVDSKIKVCLATPTDLLDNIEEIAEAEKAANKRPVAALIVSCIGRKMVLGKKIHQEIATLTDRFPALPLLGFPSMGEIAPLRHAEGYSRSYFHNMTYALLLIEE